MDAIIENNLKDGISPSVQNIAHKDTILVIEDEHLMSALLKRYIDANLKEKNIFDYKIEFLEDGWDLLTTDLSHVKLAVVDILLPRVTGVDLIKSFRQRHPEMGLIPISGMATEPLKRQLRQVLNSDFELIDKPLRRAVFNEAFEKAFNFKQTLEPRTPLKEEEGEPLWTSVENKKSNDSIPIVHRKLLRKKSG